MSPATPDKTKQAPISKIVGGEYVIGRLCGRATEVSNALSLSIYVSTRDLAYDVRLSACSVSAFSAFLLWPFDTLNQHCFGQHAFQS